MSRIQRMFFKIEQDNALITEHSFMAETLEMIFDILPFFSPTHEITYITGYRLTTDDEYSVHLGHIWPVFKCVKYEKICLRGLWQCGKRQS